MGTGGIYRHEIGPRAYLRLFLLSQRPFQMRPRPFLYKSLWRGIGSAMLDAFLTLDSSTFI